jgi:hypothetical protein
MKSEEKRSNPEARRCHHASPQVAYNYALCGYTIHLADHRDSRVFGKMMQNL